MTYWVTVRRGGRSARASGWTLKSAERNAWRLMEKMDGMGARAKAAQRDAMAAGLRARAEAERAAKAGHAEEQKAGRAEEEKQEAQAPPPKRPVELDPRLLEMMERDGFSRTVD